MPSLVLPCHRVPGEWYTRLSVLTQTWPLLAGAGVVRRLVAGAGVASWAGAFIGMVVASAAPHDCTPPWPRQAPARFGTAEGCAVLAGGCDRTCPLRLGGVFGGGRGRGRLDRLIDEAARLWPCTP